MIVIVLAHRLRLLTKLRSYRDLKPENILLDSNGHVVLCDFGLSKVLKGEDDRCKTLCGTTSFLAPGESSFKVSSRLGLFKLISSSLAEVLLDVGYSYPADWWSLGVLLFEMSWGWSPFYAETAVEEYERILSSEIKIPNKGGYSAELKDMVLQVSSPSHLSSRDTLSNRQAFPSDSSSIETLQPESKLPESSNILSSLRSRSNDSRLVNFHRRSNRHRLSPTKIMLIIMMLEKQQNGSSHQTASVGNRANLRKGHRLLRRPDLRALG